MENTEMRNPRTNVCQSVIWNRAFSKWALHKTLPRWENILLLMVSEAVSQQLNINSLGSTLGQMVSCPPLRSLVVFTI